jgi:hypothetical protein
VSDCTRRRSAADQHRPNVTALFTDVVLDDTAVRTERLALLAELTAEQLGMGYACAGVAVSDAGLDVLRHLECAASLAREVAEGERARCVATYGGAVCASASETQP